MFLAWLPGLPSCSPKSNSSFWATKFARNRAKDARIFQQLINEGIQVVRFWEHELRVDLNTCISQVLSLIK
jgi:DNA mismatch endonuclease (patch repair protein)